MQELVHAVVVFAVMCASASLGLFVHRRLPEKHRSPESREVLRQGVTLLVTFTAIVLGLLTTSVKVGFDIAYRDRGDFAAQLTQLDRCLSDYGAETAVLREQLRSYVAGVIASTWPSEPHPAGISYPDPSKMRRTGAAPALAQLFYKIGFDILALPAANALQKTIASACAEQYRDTAKARWKVVEEFDSSISAPFYWMLVFWLAVLFGVFGLASRSNVLIAAVIGLCVLAIAIDVFVILDMDRPYGGLFGIPSTAMWDALSEMVRGRS
jgi:hypothetical protein